MKGKLIGFTGDPRTGKDTMADLFVEQFGYIKVAFADPLYQEISDAFNVSIESLKTDKWKTHAQPELAPLKSHNGEFVKVCKSLGLFEDEALSSRRVLQIWGTEYRRVLYGCDYWVGQMIGKLRTLRGRDVAFSDVRFDIEACMGHWHVSKGYAESFKLIRILRAGSIASQHDSDSGVSKFLIDGTVRNNTIPGECLTDVLTILEKGQESRINGKG